MFEMETLHPSPNASLFSLHDPLTTKLSATTFVVKQGTEVRDIFLPPLVK